MAVAIALGAVLGATASAIYPTFPPLSAGVEI